jgi:3-oxoacyl-[acyl-carrier-protein] synthase II
MNMERRVVITGIGVVTSIGSGREAFWRNLLAGRSGISEVVSFPTTAYKTHRGGEVKDFQAEDYVERLNPAKLGRASQFAIAAARLALEDAAIDLSAFAPEQAGVAVGTTYGESQVVERFNDCYVSRELNRIGPELASLYPCHVIAAHVASELKFGGVNMTLPAACASGNYAIAHAFDALRSSRAELVLAGGSDAFSRLAFTGFSQLGAIAPERCQPFDRNRRGMIPGEGAGMLALEPLDRALARGARIYAEIAGYGLSCDAHHMTAAHPKGEGAARAMRQALAESDLQPEEISYISAHGTGTPTNDRLETIAVKQAFNGAAYRIPISSIKSMLGHTMGAASAIEAAACSLSVFHDRIPPTINLEEPDPECDLDYVPNEAREHRVEVAMNNAYAFGGNNATLIFRKYPWN